MALPRHIHSLGSILFQRSFSKPRCPTSRCRSPGLVQTFRSAGKSPSTWPSHECIPRVSSLLEHVYITVIFRSSTLQLIHSHLIGPNWNINQIQNTHDAVGFVRPGGYCSQILNSFNIEEENLQEDDALVLFCGSNDVGVNRSVEAIKQQDISTPITVCTLITVVSNG